MRGRGGKCRSREQGVRDVAALVPVRLGLRQAIGAAARGFPQHRRQGGLLWRRSSIFIAFANARKANHRPGTIQTQGGRVEATSTRSTVIKECPEGHGRCRARALRSTQGPDCWWRLVFYVGCISARTIRSPLSQIQNRMKRFKRARRLRHLHRHGLSPSHRPSFLQILCGRGVPSRRSRLQAHFRACRQFRSRVTRR